MPVIPRAANFIDAGDGDDLIDVYDGVRDEVDCGLGNNDSAKGDLSIAGKSQSVSVPISVSDDKISGSYTFTTKDFGIKQFSALFGALKVKEEVTVEFEGSL